MQLFVSRKKNRPRVAAIIVAAGGSVRMGGEDKLMMLLQETPAIVHTLSAFENSDAIDEIVLVTRQERIPIYFDLVREYGFEKIRRIVRGGMTRQLSVYEGILAADILTEYYAIHDGARPLVNDDIIRRTIEAAVCYKAAVAGVRVKDTIKVADDERFIRHTPRRETLYSIQTPQVFEAALYREAIGRAVDERRDYTDDAQLFESAGHKVYICEGSYNNLKLTTPEDIIVADALLSQEGEKSYADRTRI